MGGTEIVTGVLSFLGGGVTGLLLPWSKWGVDKRKADRNHRRHLIETWRAGIANLDEPYGAVGTPWYESLRAHLTDDEIREEWKVTTTFPTSPGSSLIHLASVGI